jgi:hypothetical protein
MRFLLPSLRDIRNEYGNNFLRESFAPQPLGFSRQVPRYHSRAASTANGSDFQIVSALKIVNKPGLNRPPSETFLRDCA